eukprot:gnl/TRDRNA2_/TRDRNA2_75428_c0_seq1.p1 gnl/TRDRNA2_/TRDRNA2_75428_c0~~gnl/TRDRNA2_/TRDRNA2_75428_c0_seq1.p1  ORF type:complete len:324 (+),score=73.65 gnl/TRDRNA2_/TRDRNA2_75428_c0_seq1:65-973(+)
MMARAETKVTKDSARSATANGTGEGVQLHHAELKDVTMAFPVEEGKLAARSALQELIANRAVDPLRVSMDQGNRAQLKDVELQVARASAAEEERKEAARRFVKEAISNCARDSRSACEVSGGSHLDDTELEDAAWLEMFSPEQTAVARSGLKQEMARNAHTVKKRIWKELHELRVTLHIDDLRAAIEQGEAARLPHVELEECRMTLAEAELRLAAHRDSQEVTTYRLLDELPSAAAEGKGAQFDDMEQKVSSEEASAATSVSTDAVASEALEALEDRQAQEEETCTLQTRPELAIRHLFREA